MRAVFGLLLVIAGWSAHAQDGPPAWAYPIALPDFVPPPDDGSKRHAPGSAAGYTLTDIRDLFFAIDWFPNAHPPLPAIVAQGRRPDLRACGVCHRPEGIGGPENASLAGLPAEYMLRQIEDYRSGARSTAVKGRAHVFRMVAALKAATDDELKAAVVYFAALNLPPRIRVIETERVPTSYVPNWYYTPRGDGQTEALGERIIEMPDDEEAFVNRDSRVTFSAFVPLRSLSRGAALVAGTDARIPGCAGCHGEELRGVGTVPPIAGRSPSMVFRQLYEFQAGVRHGQLSAPMRANAAAMTQADMIAVAAYLASLTP